MTKILIIDDANAGRTTKTRMYAMFAKMKGAEVTSDKLQNSPSLQGYDIILTDLDGKSASDNQAFLALLEVACCAGAKPAVKMFFGSFSGQSTDLPVPVPQALQELIETHNDTQATKVITAAILALGEIPGRGTSPSFP